MSRFSLLNSIKKIFLRMTENLKRPLSPESNEKSVTIKKQSKQDKEPEPFIEGKPKFRMHAILLMYSGVGYFGMQRNRGFKTLESDLLDGLYNAGLITEEMRAKPTLIRFQRASKTDKDVSAAGQVCSCKLPAEPNLLSLMNQHLPDQLRVIDVFRAIKSFHAQHWCHYRSYQYVCPSFAFSPRDSPDRHIEKYRIPADRLTRLQQVLQLYQGTKNYHNFTSGRKCNDPSCQRFMKELFVSPPFLEGENEYIVITIRGQSFMLHQIRKMIGLTISILRGFTDEGSFEKVFSPERFDIPKAPGLGLLLDKVHYDVYNKKFPDHTSIDWEKYKEQIDDFKHSKIFQYMVKTEMEEKSMLRWLDTLCLHTYDQPRSARSPPTSPQISASPLGENGALCVPSDNEPTEKNGGLPHRSDDSLENDLEKEAKRSVNL